MSGLLADRFIQDIVVERNRLHLARLEVHDHNPIAHNASHCLKTGVSAQTKDELTATANLVLATAAPREWADYLIGLKRDKHFIFGVCEDESLAIRRNRQKGIKFFDQQVPKSIRLHTFDLYLQWHNFWTQGLLHGLDFTNIAIAGGCALACLTAKEHDSPFESSDVDIFFYDIDAISAYVKVLEIEALIKKNAPVGQHYVVKRNVKTITFKPSRESDTGPVIQVVLRLHENVGDIIANFDLPVTAIAFTGDEVWMEPRALYAIMTGLMPITEKMLAMTHIDRIVKYARRGYGLVLRSLYPAVFNAPLLTKATENYDWIAQVLHSARRDDDSWTPPHRTVELNDVLTQIRSGMTGPWLGTYSDFSVASAIWDHAIRGSMPRLLSIFKNNSCPAQQLQDPAGVLDYNIDWPLDHEEDWEEVIRHAFELARARTSLTAQN